MGYSQMLTLSDYATAWFRACIGEYPAHRFGSSSRVLWIFSLIIHDVSVNSDIVGNAYFCIQRVDTTVNYSINKICLDNVIFTDLYHDVHARPVSNFEI